VIDPPAKAGGFFVALGEGPELRLGYECDLDPATNVAGGDHMDIRFLKGRVRLMLAPSFIAPGILHVLEEQQGAAFLCRPKATFCSGGFL
jgi:hypothetical protein